MPVSSNVAQIQQVAMHNPDEALNIISMIDRKLLNRDDRAALKDINRDINPVIPQMRRKLQSELKPVGISVLGGHVPVTEQKNHIPTRKSTMSQESRARILFESRRNQARVDDAAPEELSNVHEIPAELPVSQRQPAVLSPDFQGGVHDADHDDHRGWAIVTQLVSQSALAHAATGHYIFGATRQRMRALI